MTKDDIVQKVKELDLPSDSYIVFGSCPLAAAGIREASDIDMVVSPAVFEQLKQSGWPQIDKGGTDRPLVYDVFDVHEAWNFTSYDPTLAELQERATIIDDVPFASIIDVRAWKQASGRPKDLRDLELIDQYLAQRQAA